MIYAEIHFLLYRRKRCSIVTLHRELFSDPYKRYYARRRRQRRRRHSARNIGLHEDYSMNVGAAVFLFVFSRVIRVNFTQVNRVNTITKHK